MKATVIHYFANTLMRISIALLAFATPLLAQTQTPRAIYTDPPRDSAHPARMETIHVPTGGVRINGVAYLASGAGRHPTFVFFHGLPGNEKNLDLAQAVRRAGWNAITVNYRGSWGSPGEFKFANNLDDADAVLAFLHDSANAASLGVDQRRIVIAGHSMGGWVTVHTASHHPELAGAIIISAADMGRLAGMPRVQLATFFENNGMESLATTTSAMADEIIANGEKWRFANAAEGLTRVPLLVITSDDGLKSGSDALVKAMRAASPNARIVERHETTDHSFSDKRIALERDVLAWLLTLR